MGESEEGKRRRAARLLDSAWAPLRLSLSLSFPHSPSLPLTHTRRLQLVSCNWGKKQLGRVSTFLPGHHKTGGKKG